MADDDEPIRRLNHLFNTVRRPDGRLWSDRAAARALTDSGHSISYTQIGHFRAGRREPRFTDMMALAKLFGQPSTYFTEPNPQQQDTGTVDPRGLSADRLAGKIRLLFEASHGANKAPRTEGDIVAEINSQGEADVITVNELHQLRTTGTPVTTPHLAAIARAFRVDPAYFDPVDGTPIEDDLKALVAMRDLRVRRIAARCYGQPDDRLTDLAEIMTRVARALDDQAGNR